MSDAKKPWELVELPTREDCQRKAIHLLNQVASYKPVDPLAVHATATAQVWATLATSMPRTGPEATRKRQPGYKSGPAHPSGPTAQGAMEGSLSSFLEFPAAPGIPGVEEMLLHSQRQGMTR